MTSLTAQIHLCDLKEDRTSYLDYHQPFKIIRLLYSSL